MDRWLNKIHTGDALEVMRDMPDGCVQCCVTSPPYWGLRNYGVDGQIGLEQTHLEYVDKMVSVFREVRRILTNDGTLWLNLGDSYASGKGTCYNPGGNTSSFNVHLKEANVHPLDRGNKSTLAKVGIKPKDLVGIPWRVAFALQADGWYLRQDIIWAKPNPMPESVRDRCTKAHEYLFLMTKSARYYWNADAIKEASIYAGDVKDYTGNQKNNSVDPVLQATRIKGRKITVTETRNKRSVWTIPTSPCKEAHFAVFPEALIEPCILAGSKPGDVILDPFSGISTVAVVAHKLRRDWVMIELNPEYVAMAEARLRLETAQLRLMP